jgi:nucleoside-diphosphate-sugar epimerase
MRVFVTGGSGFVGTAVIEELVARNHSVNALVNRHGLKAGGGAAREAKGSLFDPVALDEGLRGCDAVIHLVGIIMEKRSRGVTFERIHYQGTVSVVDAARRNGVRRFVHMSALGVRPDAVSDYHKTKYRAEQYLRDSGLEWTIIRPSLIHGPGGEFMRMEAMWARKRAPFPVGFMPFMPYFGAGKLGFGGAGRLQPVYVKDVARAFVDALENRRTVGEVYLLGGPDQLTWPELHRTVSQAVVGRRRWVMPIPVWAGKLYAAIGVAPLLGFNRDQVIMSQEDNTADITKFRQDFGWEPQPFEPSLREYARQL